MSRSWAVPVKPEVMKWARETIGKTVQETAKRLGVSEDTVEKWETTGEKVPTLRHLRVLSGFYKRPLAAFLLPAAPREEALPTDFRTFPSKIKKPFSEKTLLVLRRARRLRRLAGELVGKQVARDDFGKATIFDNAQEWAERARVRLAVALDTQFQWNGEALALSRWRKAVERIGVYVFEMPFPIEQGRAFSLIDDGFPAIVVNARDATVARIFSLFHEYAHLLLGQAGICDLSEENKSVEQFCNRFASEFLVPGKALISHAVVSAHSASPVWMDDELRHLACDFKVSRDVILLRLLRLNRTTQSFYDQKKQQWEAEPKRKPWGKKIPSRQCVRQNGLPFVSIVLESARSGNITARDVSDYLDIPLKYLPDVESIVREESAEYA